VSFIRFAAAPLVAASLLAGCVQHVAIAPIVVAPADPAKQRPGRFAVWMPTAAWQMDASATGTPGRIAECSGMRFAADLGPVYETALRAALASAFQHVEFLSAPLAPQELAARGYRAQFVFRPVGFRLHSGPTGASLSVSYMTSLEAAATFVYSDAEGERPPQPLSGMGGGSSGVMLICTQIGDSMGDAAHDALTNLVQHELDGARAALAVPPPARLIPLGP
jgi:hypothetical protein